MTTISTHLPSFLGSSQDFPRHLFLTLTGSEQGHIDNFDQAPPSIELCSQLGAIIKPLSNINAARTGSIRLLRVAHSITYVLKCRNISKSDRFCPQLLRETNILRQNSNTCKQF